MNQSVEQMTREIDELRTQIAELKTHIDEIHQQIYEANAKYDELILRDGRTFENKCLELAKVQKHIGELYDESCKLLCTSNELQRTLFEKQSQRINELVEIIKLRCQAVVE